MTFKIKKLPLLLSIFLCITQASQLFCCYACLFPKKHLQRVFPYIHHTENALTRKVSLQEAHIMLALSQARAQAVIILEVDGVALIPHTATAIPSVLAFYNELSHHGFKFIFLTRRPESSRDETCALLHHAGYTTFESIYFAPEIIAESSSALRFDNCFRYIGSWKEAMRNEIAAQGYLIYATIDTVEACVLGSHAGIFVIQMQPDMYNNVVE